MYTAGRHCLYLACYDDTRTKEQGLRLHWALLVAPPPQEEDPESFEKSNTRYHVTSTGGRWEFDRRQIECVRTPMMVCRILVGTVDRRDLACLDEELSDPRRTRAVEDLGWDCRGWAEDALVTLVEERWLRLANGVRLDRLFAFAQNVSERVSRKGLNVGYGLPITVRYRRPTLTFIRRRNTYSSI